MDRRRKFSGDNELQLGLFDNLSHMNLTVPGIAKAAEEMRRKEREEREGIALAGTVLRFISFGSGSSGNSAYLGDGRAGILIDAGVDIDRIEKGLSAHGIDLRSVSGVCLTHDHSDHVRYVYSLVRRYPHIAIFCTPRVLNGLLRRHSISRRVKDFHRPIYKEFTFNPAAGFKVTAFEVSHDGLDNAGFFVEHTPSGQNFAIATDLGCITDRVDHYMRLADYVMLESNYDACMLAEGPYPARLKARIAADNGHLDNVVTGDFLAQIYTPALKNVFLCHLSQDNNTPELALRTVSQRLEMAGIAEVSIESTPASNGQLRIVALPRYEASELFVLRRGGQNR